VNSSAATTQNPKSLPARFIAAAHELVPELLAEIERLRSLVEHSNDCGLQHPKK
jgi:hypothetical protein